jgi:hypothetical protein
MLRYNVFQTYLVHLFQIVNVLFAVRVLAQVTLGVAEQCIGADAQQVELAHVLMI